MKKNKTICLPDYLIDHLAEQSNQSEYIASLIVADIKKINEAKTPRVAQDMSSILHSADQENAAVEHRRQRQEEKRIWWESLPEAERNEIKNSPNWGQVALERFNERRKR